MNKQFKGYMKWKNKFEWNPLNFWSYKDLSLQLLHISFQSWDIWICLICKYNSTPYVTLHNDVLGNQEYHWGCETKSLKVKEKEVK